METDLISRMAMLVFQLGVIVFAAWAGGKLFKKLKFPVVLGELIAGVIIGPYLLGSLPVWGFSQGLFPLFEGFPVSAELYGFTTVASIILLFLVGVETDIETFLRSSLGGLFVGAFGVFFSFILGDLAGVLCSRYIFGVTYGFTHPIPLFLGVISTATSVGITARILSENRKLDSPDGVTIISAAVIDDVLGIIALAIIIGIAKSHQVQWRQVAYISLKAIGIWLGFTVLGLVFSRKISNVLKKFKDQGSISIMSLALTFIVAGIFEKSGLAMIIGAYVMGLSVSRMDLSFTVQANLSILRRFFVPIFFCVMGMLVNVNQMFSWASLTFGMIYVVFAVLGKFVGCGLPALLLNFNARGAVNIGLGMVPRGEVALIIAGIGIASGIIPHEVFSIAVMMTFITTLIPPPILARRFSKDLPVLRKITQIKKEYQKITFAMPNPETAELILNKVLAAFDNEGFYVHHMDIPESLYQIRKDETFITLKYTLQEFEFDCSIQDSSFIHTLFYEVLADMEYLIKNLQNLTDKEKIGREIFSTGNGVKKEALKIGHVIGPLAVEANLKGATKQEIIEELADLLIRSGQLKSDKRSQALQDLFQREASTSTGMQDGIALPHAKTSAVDQVIAVIGLKKSGVDFQALDSKPSTIFIMTLTPKEHPQPYLQFMSEITKFLMNVDTRQKMTQARNNKELYEIVSSF
ncbi:MAG: cation:proton antiporter [Candidatus Omnitrophica bacterium]|nr:cation:proton antiporter [Candidatus Omnitrophota bacterium]